MTTAEESDLPHADNDNRGKLGRVGLVCRSWGAAQLSEHLDDTIEVCKPRTKTVDKLVEYELAVDQIFGGVVDFFGHPVQVFNLDTAQSLGRIAAGFR